MDGFLFLARHWGCRQAKVLPGLVLAAAALVLPATALADFTATLSLDQSAGTMAGSTVALGFDEKFGSTSGDGVRTVSMVLPPGLLTNESIAGGACLRSSTPDPACQVGSGTIILAGGGSQAFTVDLVKPLNPADLAGLTILVGSMPVGTSEVTLRAGGGATVVSNLAPETEETKFSLMDRLPTSCPSPAADVTMTAVSQSGASVTATAPLTVTGCSALPYAPTLAVSEATDAKDNGATLGLDTTQAPNEAASKTIMLKLPSDLQVNRSADSRCLTGAGCVVGTATATSPLAPTKLTGTVTLAGPATSPTVTASFPPPFAITLVGEVSLTGGKVTINNVPDVPLTDVTLTITGPHGQKAFTTSCAPSTTTATFTSQSGVTKTVSSKVGLNDCAASPTASGSAGGLAAGHPKLRLTARQGRGAAKITSVAVGLPAGLRFARSGSATSTRCVTKHGKKKCAAALISGLRVSGAGVEKAAVKGGELEVTLTKATGSVTVTVSGPVLTESSSLQRSVKKDKVKTVAVTLKITNAKHTTTAVPVMLKAR